MKNFDQLIAAHEAYVRREPGGCRAQFRFAELPGVDLQRKQLKEIEFAGCDLTGSHMGLSNFSFASFYGSDLSNCDLRGSHFVRADLRGVALSGAKLCFANLDEADFRKAALMKAEEDQGYVANPVKAGTSGGDNDSISVNFSDCSLKGARLTNSRLQGAAFDGALLEGADLKGANLLDASFKGAILTNAELEGTQVSEGALAEALRDPDDDAIQQACVWRKMIEASAIWLASSGKEGAKAILDGADLRVLSGVFQKARLAAASMRNVCAVGVDFSGASLVGANFSGADLRYAKFAGADLRGCSFKDCNLTQVSFAGANLRPLAGSENRQYQPRFEGARLAGIDLTGSQLDPALQTDLAGAAKI